MSMYQQAPNGQWYPITRAVTRQPRHTSHTFHLIMTLVTCGLWLPIWATVAILNRLIGREKVVTRYR